MEKLRKFAFYYTLNVFTFYLFYFIKSYMNMTFELYIFILTSYFNYY